MPACFRSRECTKLHGDLYTHIVYIYFNEFIYTYIHIYNLGPHDDHAWNMLPTGWMVSLDVMRVRTSSSPMDCGGTTPHDPIHALRPCAVFQIRRARAGSRPRLFPPAGAKPGRMEMHHRLSWDGPGGHAFTLGTDLCITCITAWGESSEEQHAWSRRLGMSRTYRTNMNQ